MSAYEVTDKVVHALNTHQPDFICLNYANPDMVGHTGVYAAIKKAVETTDKCLGRVVEAGLEQGYSFVVIADHGNADKAFEKNGNPHTAHTLNLVPCIVISPNVEQVNDGILADIAPTVCEILSLEQPSEMTGTSLLG
jgi:2,3-bisphosphoglycerate-independent phosphoglycerate mutase